MVEVDPKLFITCRLCLEVEGQYQIVPCVQEHIKYCFDIHVEPFDRLPQLICRKCDNILKEYYALKKNFKAKQEELKTKLQNNVKDIKKSPLPQQNDSDNSLSNECNDRATKKRKHKTKRAKKKRVNRLMSSSSDELDNDSSTLTSQSKRSSLTRDTSLVRETSLLRETSLVRDTSVGRETSYVKNDCSTDQSPKSWDTNLNKYFVCRICSQKYRHKKKIKEHINEHKHLQKKYKNIFNMSCLVVMEKIDGKPNITNSINNVVYNSDWIIQNKHNHFYYTVYHPVDNHHTNGDENDHDKEVKSNEGNAESTDSEILSSKRRRILSRSSSETVVINQNQLEDAPQLGSKSKSPTVIDCIDIDDSSDSRSEKSQENDQISSLKSADCQTIDHIIKMCYNRYAKRIVSVEKKKIENDKINEMILQRKILNIGRKIITANGIHSTGILRYMEHKDLNVVCKETNTYSATSSDSKYVRIAARMNVNDNNLENNLHWKNINEYTSTANKIQRITYNSLPSVKNIRQLNSVKQNDTEQLPRISSVYSQLDLEISKVDPDNQLQKLLNPNPVLNPKQMPKKSSEASTIKITRVFSAASPSVHCDSKEPDKNIDVNISMPSLSSPPNMLSLPVSEKSIETIKVTSEATDKPDSNKHNIQYPRIKVKPVSELMPEKPTNTTANNLSTSQSAPTSNNNLKNVMLWPSPNVHVSNQSNYENSVNCTSQFPNTFDIASEYIVLDTVEFPNTRTNSPFKYLKDLLLVHNITLLDTDAPLPAEAICLIKLKLIYQQEKSEPLTLSLSLYCFGSMFCIKVRDMQMRDLNVSKLSANWQWQLLKIYNNDVAKKVLITAQRMGDETYHYTKNFFTLLNSIRYAQDVCNVNLICA